MVIGIVGLGLIGASLAKAFKYSEKVTVLGQDINNSVTEIALLSEIIDGKLCGRESECDYIFIAVDANSVVQWLKENADKIKKNAVITDCCGVKEILCDKCFDIAKEHGFVFVGGHPMAGTQFSGIKNSKYDMFYGANMVLVPKKDEDIRVLDNLKQVLMLAGFKSISVTTAKKHDEIIAFTSQLAHIVSNAYVKSPNAKIHKGFSAGSYKDLTRVAWLNENMWANLFLQNSKNVSFELENIIEELKKYKDAIDNADFDTLKELLKEGRECKERCDKL